MTKRLVIFGSGSFGLPSFEAIINSDRFEVVAVVSQPARPVGRKQIMTMTAVGQWAEKKGLSLMTPVHLRHQPEIEQTLRGMAVDFFLVADYGLIIPPEILNIPKSGAINIHASLLPEWRGASPIAQAILSGQKSTGVTLMLMDVGLDTGPIIEQWPINIDPEETRPELEQRLSLLAAEHIVSTIERYSQGQLVARNQPESHASLAPKISVDDGRATWQSAFQLIKKLRAFYPWPGVWTTWNGHRLKILGARQLAGTPRTLPGTIEPEGKTWKISCGDGWLVPTEVHFAGKKPQPAETVPGSYTGFIGSRLP